MTSLAVRAQYLERLGVPAYVPRVLKPLPIVHWEGPQEAALVFVFQHETETLDWQTPSLQLLQKIMDAVRVPQCPMALCYAPTLPIEIPAFSRQPALITFGQHLLKPARLKIIETLPLCELQYHDSAKRTLWQALKEIKAGYV